MLEDSDDYDSSDSSNEYENKVANVNKSEKKVIEVPKMKTYRKSTNDLINK